MANGEVLGLPFSKGKVLKGGENVQPRFVEMRDFLIEQLDRELTDEELAFVEWLSKWGLEVHEPAMKLFKDLANNLKTDGVN